MDFDLGQIEGNVDELQVALYDLHAELQRLATDVHAFLEAANRRDLIETINGFLGFRERTGEDLPPEDFRTARTSSSAGATTTRRMCCRPARGPRDFTDPQLLTEITALPAGDERQLSPRIPGRTSRPGPAIPGPPGQPLRLDRRRRGVRATARGVADPDPVSRPDRRSLSR